MIASFAETIRILLSVALLLLIVNQTETACFQCPYGKTTEKMGSPSLQSCFKCPAGKYLLEANMTCVTCPRGTHSQGGSVDSCLACPAGQTTAISTTETGATGAIQCSVPCATGQAVNASGSCQDCLLGSYASGGVCVQCPLGNTTSKAGRSTLSSCNIQCPIGKYVSDTGKCEGCPSGKYSSSSTRGVCLDCPAGTFTLSSGATNSSDCQACPGGTYQSIDTITGMRVCTNCPVGKYSTDGAADCTPCTDTTMTTTNFTGRVSDDDCFPCPPGMYLDSIPDSYTYLQCVSCPRGSYNPTPGAAGSCTACPEGRTTDSAGQISKSACSKCPDGNYVSDAGSCQPCPRGRYNTDATTGTGSCTACEGGVTTDRMGATSADECTDQQMICSPGQYYGNDGCTSCPLMTYDTGDNAQSCTSCPSCTTTDSTGSTSPSDCVVCPAGTYLYSSFDDSGAVATTSCLSCPLGTYSDGITPTCDSQGGPSAAPTALNEIVLAVSQQLTSYGSTNLTATYFKSTTFQDAFARSVGGLFGVPPASISIQSAAVSTIKTTSRRLFRVLSSVIRTAATISYTIRVSDTEGSTTLEADIESKSNRAALSSALSAALAMNITVGASNAVDLSPTDAPTESPTFKPTGEIRYRTTIDSPFTEPLGAAALALTLVIVVGLPLLYGLIYCTYSLFCYRGIRYEQVPTEIELADIQSSPAAGAGSSAISGDRNASGKNGNNSNNSNNNNGPVTLRDVSMASRSDSTANREIEIGREEEEDDMLSVISKNLSVWSWGVSTDTGKRTNPTNAIDERVESSARVSTTKLSANTVALRGAVPDAPTVASNASTAPSILGPVSAPTPVSVRGKSKMKDR